MDVTKDQALFYLKRRVRDLDVAPVDHQALAAKGASYQHRQELEAARAEREQENTQEQACLRRVIEIVEANWT